MTYERKSINNFYKFDQPLCIQLADNSCLYSYGKGEVYLTMPNENEKVNIVLKGRSLRTKVAKLTVFATICYPERCYC